MNESEQEQFEAELRRFPPARPPEILRARILSVKPCVRSQVAGVSVWRVVLRWLAPAAVAAVMAGLAVYPWRENVPAPRLAALKADQMQVNEKLVSSFDAVGQLPSGEAVRFRVQRWEDQVIVKDKERGLVVEESRPRLVVTPVRFESY
ncbi:MAG TPA: hypothetical protein VHB20_04380 [Verrucomicrobiae bacterium]|jgi:hypothetical protein|nr:hypothetical protein [Verrucomicrobiae bacterium]